MSDFLQTECLAVAVQISECARGKSQEERVAIERHLYFAKNLRIKTATLEGTEVARSVVDFARQNEITKIYLARPPERRWNRLMSRGLLQSIVALARDMQIVIVSERESGANQLPPAERVV